MEFLKNSLLELITQTSTNLPPDVRAAMAQANGIETPNTQAAQALAIIAGNIDMAQEDEGPICQDTGMPTFYIHTPAGVSQLEIGAAAREAIAEATRRGKLRPNSVDSLTGKNSGNNLGTETPVFHFEQWEQDEIEVRLILKGGGCENMNIQYSLPCELEHLGRADRNLEGVRKCILHAVWQAQGHGCAPGALGVCIGSDRAHGYHLAKAQLFRTARRRESQSRAGQARSTTSWSEANRIGVGAMGFGGKVSLIGCKITAANRLPASFFVSVAYDCWAFRRLGVRARCGQRRDHALAVPRPGPAGREAGRERRVPADRARDRADDAADRGAGARAQGRRRGADQRRHVHRPRRVHAYLMKNPPPVDLHGAVLYHCGPVMLKEGERWVAKAAGPTTSIREEPYQAEVIRRYGVRAVIGKGGMGAKTLAAMKEMRRRLPARDRRRGAVLRAGHRAGAGRPPAGIRHSRGDVAPACEGLPGHRDHGRPRQQPARRRGEDHRRGAGDLGKRVIAPATSSGATERCPGAAARTRCRAVPLPVHSQRGDSRSSSWPAASRRAYCSGLGFCGEPISFQAV